MNKVKFRGAVYVKIGQGSEYSTIKQLILSNKMPEFFSRLERLTDLALQFSTLLDRDRPQFHNVIGSGAAKQNKLSELGYELGDYALELEKLSNHAYKLMSTHTPQQSKPKTDEPEEVAQ